MKKVISLFVVAISGITACTSPIEIFENETNQFMSASQLQNEIISEEKIAALSEPVERFFHVSGFAGEAALAGSLHGFKTYSFDRLNLRQIFITKSVPLKCSGIDPVLISIIS